MSKPFVRPKWAVVFAAFALPAALLLCSLSATGVPRHAAQVSPATAPRVQTAAEAGGATDAPLACLWGGACNSSLEDGTGFFDRQAARQFANTVRAELRRYVVDLNARAFLPMPGKEHFAAVFPGKARLPENRATPEKRVAYLQFKDNPRDEQRRQVAARGLELLNYVSGYAWCARGTPAAFEAALSLDFVRAVAAVDARDKLHALVFRGETPDYARAAGGGARFWLLAQPGTTPEGLAWQMAGDEALAGLQAQLALRSVLGPRFEIVASVEAALRLAALDAAAFLSFVPPPFASRHAVAVAASRDATTDLESNIGAVRDNPPNVSGNGVKVVAREIGRMDPHQDFAARLTYVENDGDSSADAVNHATAVTGQIGSDGHTQPAAKGVAPGVSILAYSLTNDTFNSTDIVDAAARGARVSNHSYGPAQLQTWGDYDSISADWDGASNSNDLLVVTAGNEETGGLSKHIDSFVGAKNTICVIASSQLARAGDPSANPPSAPADGIAFFSEFGPMNDGRIKPDLAAFGGASRSGDNVAVTLDQGLSATQTNEGTSFSTPVVTGTAALVFQHYKDKVGREPSAALAKALLCNSATDLGQSGPDATYGFGILNAKAAITTIDLYQSGSLTPFVEGVTSNGNANSFSVNLQAVPQLRVTLCWLDVAGNPSAAKALVDDLDLQVVAPDGTIYYPYSLDPNNPSAAATNTGPNTVDPIEQSVVNSPMDGTWTINVVGTNIPQGHQAFAVCLNRAAVAPHTAVITASPDSGPAPLTVSFSAAQSTGTSATYAWDFGDNSSGQGATVSHTYTAAGSYTVTLTLDGGASATHLIHVTKSVAAATPLKARVALKFASKTGNDSSQFTIQAAGLKMSPADARTALRNGTFTGQTFLIKLGGTADGTTPATAVASVVLKKNATGTFKDTSFKPNPTLNFKLTPATGQVQVQLNNFFVEDLFSAGGMSNSTASNGLHDMPVEVESVDTVYRAVFHLSYKASNNGRTGTAKYP